MPRDVGTHRVPGDPRVAPHELLVDRERVVGRPGCRRAGPRGRALARGRSRSCPSSPPAREPPRTSRALPPRVVGSPGEPRAWVVPDEPGRPVGIGRREERVHRAGGRCRAEDRRIGADLIEHGEQVGSPGLEVRRRDVACRGAASAPVVDDEARELRGADEPGPQSGSSQIRSTLPANAWKSIATSTGPDPTT